MNVGNTPSTLRPSYGPVPHTQNSNKPREQVSPNDAGTQGLMPLDLYDSAVFTYLDDLGHVQDVNPEVSNSPVQSVAELHDLLSASAAGATAVTASHSATGVERTHCASQERKLVSSAEHQHSEEGRPTLGPQARQFIAELPLHKNNWSAREFGKRMAKLPKKGSSLSLTRSDIEDIVTCGFAAILYMHYEADNPKACRTAATSLLKRCAVIVSELNQYVRYLNNKAELSSEELLNLKHYSELAADIQYMVLSKDMPRAAVPYIATARSYLAHAARQTQRKISPQRFSWHPLSHITTLYPFARIEVADKKPEQFREVTYQEFVRTVAPDLQLSSGVVADNSADALPVRVDDPDDLSTRK